MLPSQREVERNLSVQVAFFSQVPKFEAACTNVPSPPEQQR